MNTKEKGDIAVGKAISYFMSNEYEVCLPIGDKQKYDLIVDKNGDLKKVQVKYSGKYTKGVGKGKCFVALRVMGGNQSYGYAKKYTKQDFDLLFVYTEKDDMYFIPWAEIDCVNSLAIECEKYEKYKVKK